MLPDFGDNLNRLGRWMFTALVIALMLGILYFLFRALTGILSP